MMRDLSHGNALGLLRGVAEGQINEGRRHGQQGTAQKQGDEDTNRQHARQAKT